MDTYIIISIVAIFALLVVSAFFSGSETALTVASKARIQKLARDGKKRAQSVAKLIEDRERLLGGILLGNNLVNILASALATSVMIHFFKEQGVVWATLIMTALVLVFAEVLPKTYAISKPDRMALAVGPAIALFVKLFSPIVTTIQKIVRFTLKLFGVDTSMADHALSAHEEIRHTIELHESEGGIVKADRDMLGSILDLNEVTLEDIMVHRKNMLIADIALPPEEIISFVVASPFSRIPLWRDNKENIVGIVHAKDILRAVRRRGLDLSKLRIDRIMNKPWFVPETTTLREQLNAFLERRDHMAMVVDEYGSLMGMVTLEDILEEIVGEISDEYDFETEGVKVMENGSVLVDGTVSIRDLNRQLDWNLPDENATTLAGLILNEAEMIPIVGDHFNFFNMEFQIVSRVKNQITKISIIPAQKIKKHHS
ncbi:MAG: HlyC/CorC family transporter [Sphingomonadales bacterium]|nr:HlyC/CorC family transporter [Sphingomonadales bacterium]